MTNRVKQSIIQIDFRNETITLANLQSLQPYQSSQLHYWGFIQRDSFSELVKQNIDVKRFLSKLVEYLEEEDLQYILSEQCQKILSDHEASVDHLNSIRDSSNRFKAGKLDVKDFGEFRNFVENRITRKLREHQLKAAYHLYITQNGANFSAPGSGKTTVVLTVYEKLKSEGKVNCLYVVGPPACFGPWKTEFFETLGRIPNAKIFAGGDKNVRKNEYYGPPSSTEELYLSTFQTVSNDISDVKSFFNLRGVFPMLVVDEAHYIKQQGGVWANALLELSTLAPVKCVLTGTPIPNRYSDVFNLFDFLWGENQLMSVDEKNKIVTAEMNHNTARAQEIVRKTVTPLFYRVRKVDLGLRDQIFLSPYRIKMNDIERKIYLAIESRIRSFDDEQYLRNIELITKLRRGRITRLRQCASYAKMLQSAIEGYEEDLVDRDSEVMTWITTYDTLEKPAKLEFLSTLVQSFAVKKEKIVIWANFIGTIELISITLAESGYQNEKLYGKTPTEYTALKEEETRESIVRRFLDPESRLDTLIANPAACAESISLHKACQHAIYYDLSYNCAQYLQSLDRIHRVGASETKEAYYHFLQYDNTIDVDIKDSLERKANRMYQIIDEDCTIYSLDMFEDDIEDEKAYERLFTEKQ